MDVPSQPPPPPRLDRESALGHQFKGWIQILLGVISCAVGVLMVGPGAASAVIEVGLGALGGLLMARGWVVLSSAHEDLAGKEAWWDFFRWL